MEIVYAALGAVAVCIFYLVARQVRTVFAWGMGREQPKERLGFMLTISAVLGATAGWLAYEPVQTVLACQQAGEPLFACLLAN